MHVSLLRTQSARDLNRTKVAAGCHEEHNTWEVVDMSDQSERTNFRGVLRQ